MDEQFPSRQRERTSLLISIIDRKLWRVIIIISDAEECSKELLFFTTVYPIQDPRKRLSK